MPQSNRVKCLDYHISRLALVGCQLEVRNRRHQDMVNLVEGVVHLKRVLHYRLHLAPEVTTLTAAQSRDIHPVEVDGTRSRRYDAQQQPRQGRLTATRLARDCDDAGILSRDRQTHVINGHRGLAPQYPAAEDLRHATSIKRHVLIGAPVIGGGGCHSRGSSHHASISGSGTVAHAPYM